MIVWGNITSAKTRPKQTWTNQQKNWADGNHNEMVNLWLPLDLIVLAMLLLFFHSLVEIYLFSSIECLSWNSFGAKEAHRFCFNCLFWTKTSFFYCLLVCIAISKINFNSTIYLCPKPRFARRTHGELVLFFLFIHWEKCCCFIGNVIEVLPSSQVENVQKQRVQRAIASEWCLCHLFVCLCC